MPQGAAGSVRPPAAESADLGGEFLVIDGDAQPLRTLGPRGGFIGVLDHGLPRLPQQQFPRQWRGGQPCRNHDEAPCGGPRPGGRSADDYLLHCLQGPSIACPSNAVNDFRTCIQASFVA